MWQSTASVIGVSTPLQNKHASFPILCKVFVMVEKGVLNVQQDMSKPHRDPVPSMCAIRSLIGPHSGMWACIEGSWTVKVR